MRNAAASTRMQVQAESSMLTTHASLATELQQAEALAKVWRAVRHLLFHNSIDYASTLLQGPRRAVERCLRHMLKSMS